MGAGKFKDILCYIGFSFYKMISSSCYENVRDLKGTLSLLLIQSEKLNQRVTRYATELNTISNGH